MSNYSLENLGAESAPTQRADGPGCPRAPRIKFPGNFCKRPTSESKVPLAINFDDKLSPPVSQLAKSVSLANASAEFRTIVSSFGSIPRIDRRKTLDPSPSAAASSRRYEETYERGIVLWEERRALPRHAEPRKIPRLAPMDMSTSKEFSEIHSANRVNELILVRKKSIGSWSLEI
ncbi:hypothetical protein KM043_005031 [Ampulex compressa]|nr:hypothetical protein KM043_005031 [Ampulex compressa]